MNEQNLNSFFYTGENQEDTLLNNISLSIGQKKTLLNARKIIRTHLSQTVPKDLDKRVREQGLKLNNFPKPRFFTQGSWAYQTINSPARPPQQADLDDGMYLPLGAVDQEPPSEISKLLLQTVEDQLKTLCKANPNWSVDVSNPNCTRVILNEHMHIDVPLYVIPTEDFKTLETAASTSTAYNSQMILESSDSNVMGISKSLGLDSFILDSDESFARYFQDVLKDDLDSWSKLETDQVLMATASGWKNSDPRPIKDWVEYVVSIKSEQLRRVMRYVKAWRDHMDWPLNDPKSILLMVAAEKAFYSEQKDRDDKALFHVIERMIEIILSNIQLPTNSDECLSDKLDSPHNIRMDVYRRLKAFHEDFERAYKSNSTDAAALLTKHLGDRLPSGPTATKRVTIASALATTPSISIGSQEPSGRVVQA